MKYQIIYADPPWKYGSKELYGDKDGSNKRKNRFRTLDRIYPTMNEKELSDLPIRELSDKDCALFMWVTDSHLKQGISVMEHWNFKYKTIAFVWVKTYNSGKICTNIAPYTIKSCEICLLGIKGRMANKKVSNRVRQLIIQERTSHSKKPQEARNRIVELFGNLSRIELFARERADGWDVWGNEVQSDIKL